MVELHAACHEILGRILRDRQEQIPPTVDIALQQMTTGSRIDLAFVCAAAKNQVRRKVR
jgi:hypothetical protein